MTITPFDMLLYAGAIFILFLTPGPVWVALLARALSGGFQSAWPLALGVVVGDALWPVLAVLGVAWLVDQFAGFMTVLRWVAVIMFVAMGIQLIRTAGKELTSDTRLTRPGMWAGFIAGVVVILGNPKAILFYMGVLPGFFDLTQITWLDVVVICLISLIVPFIGNLILALFVDRARVLLKSPGALKRLNQIAGVLLILVGGVIAVG